LEVISPARFERFFAELVDLGGMTQADPRTLADLGARYAVGPGRRTLLPPERAPTRRAAPGGRPATIDPR
jgi:hypothetical protein